MDGDQRPMRRLIPPKWKLRIHHPDPKQPTYWGVTFTHVSSGQMFGIHPNETRKYWHIIRNAVIEDVFGGNWKNQNFNSAPDGQCEYWMTDNAARQLMRDCHIDCPALPEPPEAEALEFPVFTDD